MSRPTTLAPFFAVTDLHALAALLVGATEISTIPSDELNALVKLARTHGVAPMLYHRLRASGIDLETPPLRALNTAHQNATRHYLSLKAGYDEISRVLVQQNIPAIWLKGFALAHTIYPHPHLRPMRDLDVLVPKAQRAHARAALAEIGYTLRDVPHSDAVRAMWQHDPLQGRVLLELHSTLIGLRSNLLDEKNLAWFWSNTRVIQSQDLPFTAFNMEAELLYLAAHALLQHGEHELKLQRYLDIHLHIEKNAPLDWRALCETAKHFQWTYALLRALEITREYFSSNIPDATFAELRAQPTDAQIAHAQWIRADSTRLEITRGIMAAMSRREQLAWVIGSLFPAPLFMRSRYPERAAWNLPRLYLYRWLHITRDVLQTMLKWARQKFFRGT